MTLHNNPRISLIVPTYNASETINHLLLSIKEQTNQNYEVIVIDGCSNDDTLQIFNASNINISKVVTEKDEGIYDAINKGISLASGDLINVIGADDVFANKHVFDKVLTVFKNTKSDIYAGKTIQ